MEHLDVVGEVEHALEGTRRDALIKVLVLLFLGLAALDGEHQAFTVGFQQAIELLQLVERTRDARRAFAATDFFDDLEVELYNVEIDLANISVFSLLPPDAKPDLELNRTEMEKYRADMRKDYLGKTPRFN